MKIKFMLDMIAILMTENNVVLSSSIFRIKQMK